MFSQPDIRVSSLLRRGLEKISGVRSSVWCALLGKLFIHNLPFRPPHTFFFFFWNVKELLISSLHKKHEVQPWKLIYFVVITSSCSTYHFYTCVRLTSGGKLKCLEDTSAFCRRS